MKKSYKNKALTDENASFRPDYDDCGRLHASGEEVCCDHGHDHVNDDRDHDHKHDYDCGHDHDCKHTHCDHDHEHDHGHAHDHERDCGCKHTHCDHGHNHDHIDHGHKHDHDCGHDHGHSHTDGCECCAAKGHVDVGNAKKLKISDFIKPIIKISCSAVLAAIGAICQFGAESDASGGLNVASIVIYCLAYVVVGYEYVIQAVKGVFKGDVFNENMLMTVASVGAMALGEYVEGVAVMLLYCVGETLQDAAIAKSKGDIVRLLGLKAESCLKIEGDSTVEVDSESLEVGDLVIVRKGEKIPSDGVVEEGESAVDCSSMTGESMPVAVAVGSEVSGGTVNTGNSLKVRISKKFEDTQASKILRLVEDAQENKPKAQKLITKFAAIYTPTVFALALIVAFLPPLFYENYAVALTEIWLKKALVFLVISCPCALVISIPLAFFAGIGKCSKQGVLVKGGNYLEAMRGITAICMDKTGTLTKGVFEVTSAVTSKGFTTQDLKEAARVCESMSTHPIAISVLKYAGGGDVSDISDYREYAGKGVGCTYKGKKLVAGNLKLMRENGVNVTDVSEGYGSAVYFARDGIQIGYVTLSDAVKEDAKGVVAALKTQGKKVIMLTGDTEENARLVAKSVGIDEYRASLLPQDKYEAVEQLKASGEKVMFVGDGLNDAPAIKAANLGVCVGGLGNDASVEASDVVLSTGSVSGIPRAFAVAEKTKRRVTENIVLSLVAKVAIMVVSLVWNPMMWLAVIADVGVCIVAIINSVRK